MVSSSILKPMVRTRFIFQRLRICPYLTAYTKINSKWIEDLNVRSETIKILEESIHARLWDISISDGFFFFFFWILTLKAKTTKAKINKQDYINLKSICKVKKIVNKMKIYE